MISPIGNQIYVNQNMHVAATKIGNRLGSAEYAQLANQISVDDKDKDIREIRPVEESAKIDPDREHQKHHNRDEEEAQHEAQEQYPHDNIDKEIEEGIPKEASRYKKLDFLA
jgi:hypothetical protein